MVIFLKMMFINEKIQSLLIVKNNFIILKYLKLS